MPEPTTRAARKALRGTRRAAAGAAVRSRGRGAVEFGHELTHAPVDVVARGTDLGERAVLGVRQVPVEAELLLAGYHGAGAAAAHRDHGVCLRGELGRQGLRPLRGHGDA